MEVLEEETTKCSIERLISKVGEAGRENELEDRRANYP